MRTEERRAAKALYYVIEAEATIQNKAGLEAIARIKEELLLLNPSEGMPVSDASEILMASEPAVRSWVKRGAIQAVPGSKPLEIDLESLYKASLALAEFRERNWLDSLIDYTTDLKDKKSIKPIEIDKLEKA